VKWNELGLFSCNFTGYKPQDLGSITGRESWLMDWEQTIRHFYIKHELLVKEHSSRFPSTRLTYKQSTYNKRVY